MTVAVSPVTEFREHWSLDPSIAYLNHGSFGACPVVVLEAQRRLRDQLEAEPVRFFVRELEPMLASARVALGNLIGADADDIAFVSNATTGVNTVLRSLRFEPGDELLTTDHEYNACRNALEFVAERAGARVVVAKIPFPLEDAEQVVAAIVASVTDRTRLALIDHVTSPTGLVLPIARIVSELNARGIDTLVDGAHAPGMVALELRTLGAAYYTGNCHKWLCAPKGAAMLWVRRDRQKLVRPLTISHGANASRTGRSRFRMEFDWTGTDDPTAHLCIPESIRFLESIVPGGLTGLMTRNRSQVLAARAVLCEALRVAAPCPDEMIGSLAAVPLPDDSRGSSPGLHLDALQDALFADGIEVPVIAWPAPPKRLIRVSAQVYNKPTEYVRLASRLVELLAR